MAYTNSRGNLGQGQGELPTEPSQLEMVPTCPRCSQPMEVCHCDDWKDQYNREP